MVYIVEVDGVKYYACEVCGLLYELEAYARDCEEYCKAHPGSCNVDLAKHSIGYVNLREGVQKVYFKVVPTRGCGKLVFKLCRSGVNIYRAC